MCRCILWNCLSIVIESKSSCMVQWGNSLSITFRYSNWIRQGGQLSSLLYNVYIDDLNHHLQATGVGYYVGGARVNSLSYADDMVLLAPTVTALHTLLEVCRAYAGPHDNCNHRCRAQFKCAQTVIGQRSAGNGPNGLSYDYYYYYYYYNENSMYAGPTKALTGSVLNKPGSEMRNLALPRGFDT